MKKLTFLFYFATFTLFAQAKEFLPAPLIQLEPFFSHHMAIVEKATHRLHIFENQEGTPHLIKSFQIATGKYKGDKVVQGDHKTPEGIYFIQEFLSEEKLLSKFGETGKIYGSGAFTLDYPNLFDLRHRKTGSGIWLHSTDDESRIEKGLDSRGCVVVGNDDLKAISHYLELEKTPFIITDRIQYLDKTSWKDAKAELAQAVLEWMKAWQQKDFSNYIKYYHPTEFFNRFKGNFVAYKQYKKAVFARKDQPQITFSSPLLLSYQGYAVARFKQDYRSEVINDIGVKTLYLKKDENYNWKIIAETWSKLENQDSIAFSPDNHYFKEE